MASRRPNPLQLAECVLAWSESAPSDVEPVVLAVERNGRLAAGLALAIVQRGPLRRLELIGVAEPTAADVLVDRRDLDLVPRLVEAMQALDFDYAHFAALDANGILAGSARDISLIQRLAGPVVYIEPGPDAFRRLLSRSRRKALDRRTRRLHELGELSIETRATPSVLDEMFALHERRWLGDGGSSSFCTARGRAFHRSVGRRLSGTGTVRSTTIRLQGRLLAFQYAFLVGASLVCLRIAHDPDFEAYSPGTLALGAAIEDGASLGARRVELLGHQEAYKLHLATALEPMSWGIGWARTPQGALASRAERALLRLRVELRDRSRALPA